MITNLGTKYTGESQILRVLVFHIVVSWLHLPPCQNYRCGMGASTSQKAGYMAIGRANGGGSGVLADYRYSLLKGC